MMYTRERLMKAVREAGRGGRPFTLGEVRGELGLKSPDKRELKRFRSRFRECGQIFGENLEKLGPNTFRLKAGYADLQLAPATTPAATKSKAPPAATSSAIDLARRVDLPSRPRAAQEEEEDLYTQKRRPREQISYVAAEPGSGSSARNISFGERISSWFGRPREGASSTASTALSRLAVELQPKAASFEYRWIDGKLQVQRAADK